MTEEFEKSKLAYSRIAKYAVYVILIYLGMFGPMVLFLGGGGHPHIILRILYWPLFYLTENTFLDGPISWYAELWNR